MLSLDCGGGGCDGGGISEELISQFTYPLGGEATVSLPPFEEKRLLKFTYSGLYEVWWPPPPPPNPGGSTYYTTADARGFFLGWACRGVLMMWYDTPGNIGPNGACAYPLEETLVFSYKVKGNGTLRGSGPFGMILIGSPHTVTISRYETPIRLQRLNPPPTPPVGQASVLAQINPEPQWVAGSRIPIRVLSWTWTPTQVGVSAETTLTGPGASCPTGFTELWFYCSFTAKESGTLTVRASVNGGPEQEASITVNVVDCITGDTLIDRNPVVRRALRDALDGSNADATPADRIERLGGVVCTNGQCSSFLFPFEGNATPCSHLPPRLFSPPGAFPPGTVVIIHSHPFQHEEFLPSICGRRLGARYDQGPSVNDAGHVQGNSLPLVVIDKGAVHTIYPQEFAGSFPAGAIQRALRNTTWTRKRNSTCDPLSY